MPRWLFSEASVLNGLEKIWNADGSLAQFRLQVRENKCITKILETAKITEVEPKKEEAPKVKKAAKKQEEKPAAAEVKRVAAEGKPVKKQAKKTDVSEEKAAKKTKPAAQKENRQVKNTDKVM